MRFQLAGSVVRPVEVVMYLNDGDEFIPEYYIERGYTQFEVLCIGGGGGRGGGIDTENTGTLIRNFGGAGGGGGVHKVQGRLSALSPSCPVVVGSAGSPGDDHISDPAETTDGGDGGYSSFNNTTCRASGGLGGKRAQTNSDSVSTQADGGDGGVGDSITAGGGAAGGTSGIPTPTGSGATSGTNGEDGYWNGSFGEGGGGGAGGVGKYPETFDLLLSATAGGRGAYNSGDLSVYGPGGFPEMAGELILPIAGFPTIIPGWGGGAQASLFTDSSYMYGQSDNDGVVIIRLTAPV